MPASPVLKVWCRPTSTFSSAVISPNSCTFWKVRATPEAAMSAGARPTSDLPEKSTEPAVGT